MRDTNFIKLLDSEARERVKRRRAWHKRDAANTAALSDAKLAEKAEYCLRNCSVVESKYDKGDPVYDAQMHYVLIPEMIKRLRNKLQ